MHFNISSELLTVMVFDTIQKSSSIHPVIVKPIIRVLKIVVICPAIQLVSNLRLNVLGVNDWSQAISGSEFQSAGPETAKLCGP